jgi:hypothetical protein
MFGRKNHHGKAHGMRGKHNHYHECGCRFEQGHHSGSFANMRHKRAGQDMESPQVQREMVQGAGDCPLCDKRCPLVAPGCGRGKSYARSM